MYDRTVRTEKAALARLKELDAWGYEGGVYTVDWVPKDFWY